jgi:hypothetical protein
MIVIYLVLGLHKEYQSSPDLIIYIYYKPFSDRTIVIVVLLCVLANVFSQAFKLMDHTFEYPTYQQMIQTIWRMPAEFRCPCRRCKPSPTNSRLTKPKRSRWDLLFAVNSNRCLLEHLWRMEGLCLATRAKDAPTNWSKFR